MLFGKRSFGSIFAFISSIDALGFLVWCMWLFGGVYDRHADFVTETGEKECYHGNKCYRDAMLVFSALAWVGCGVMVALIRLHHRDKKKEIETSMANIKMHQVSKEEAPAPIQTQPQ